MRPLTERILVEGQPQNLSYAEARESPCMTCSRSPCCSFLPLTTLEAKTFTDLDRAVYLLNFDRIELGLSVDGKWTVHYRHPCRFLDPDDRSCTLHGTADQPHICSQYDAHTCWYRPALSEEGDGRFLRVDARRLQVVIDAVRFDEARRIVAVPEWGDLEAAFAGLPIEHDLEWDVPRTDAPAPPTTENGQRAEFRFDEPALRTPCEGCAAWCCDTLAFSLPQPATTSALDHLRFTLGFPGVSVGVQGNDWSVLVSTRCRHFANHRCGLYGDPARPLRCQNYDAWNCTYKRNLGPRPPADFARVAHAEFDALASTFVFDGNGRALHIPDGSELAQQLTAGAPTAGLRG